jgi:hypothetical protein
MQTHRNDPARFEITADTRRLVRDLTPFERDALRLFAMGMHRRDIVLGSHIRRRAGYSE